VARSPEEWLRQARHEMRSALYLLGGRRNVHAVFMCHLAVEKALKALYHKKTGAVPPKHHNLLYFVQHLSLDPPGDLLLALGKLNRMSIVTRYPDDLRKLQRTITAARAAEFVRAGQEALRWLRRTFSAL